MSREREIKFRAWDKLNKKFIYSDWKYGVVSFWEELAQDYQHQYELPQQYTGLKDKNGKDIYEDDFVIVYGEIRIVSFEKGWWMTFSPKEFYDMYQNNGHLPAGFATFIKDSDYKAIKPMYRYSEPEIIGNIYSNPELLK